MNHRRANPGIETKHLDFGSAIHAALEVFYDKEKQPQNSEQRTMLEIESLAAYLTYMQKWKAVLIVNERWHVDAQVEFARLEELGHDMLTRYFDWAKTEDEDYEIAYSEVEFEVPIEIPKYTENSPFEKLWTQYYNAGRIIQAAYGGYILATDPSLAELGIERGKYYLAIFENDENGDLQILGIVVIQGRLDLIVSGKRSGRYKIIDHKTIGQLRNDYEWMDIDPQASTYYFAAKVVLGIDVDEVIFNQLLKKAPEEPEVGKRGYISQAMSQYTTFDLYRKKIAELGHSVMQYQKFLTEYEEPTFFRRIPTSRTPDELASIQRFIILEAVDMLNDPSIYPNPSSWNCNGCAYREPCRLLHTDSVDYAEWFLTNSGAYVESQGY